MFLFKTKNGWRVRSSSLNQTVQVPPQHSLTTRDDLHSYLRSLLENGDSAPEPDPQRVAPIEQQEVWAAGVTYFRSREARVAESKDAGGGDFYTRVYDATRPELFFKATWNRVADPGESVRIRSDSTWNVPEPELALLVSPTGTILGCTIGNDMSSRSIEGENPLYLSQAKVYDRCCALGPEILISPEPLPPETRITMEVLRKGSLVCEGVTTLSAMKRQPGELVEYLLRDNVFPTGCILLTGTGIVPPDSFTLQPADVIRIRIDGIGELDNRVG